MVKYIYGGGAIRGQQLRFNLPCGSGKSGGNGGNLNKILGGGGGGGGLQICTIADAAYTITIPTS